MLLDSQQKIRLFQTNSFKDFIVRNYICNCVVFSPTAQLQISFIENILRLPVLISLIENRISYNFSYIYIIQTSSNCAVAAQLQLVSYPEKFLPRFCHFHVDIFNIHLLHQTNCQNKQKYMFQM